MILLLNNRDSFVFNLARYFTLLGEAVQVCDSDSLSLRDVEALAPEAIVISPGPCTPYEAGISLDVIRSLGEAIPILGVCLGHQAIAAAHGWSIGRAQCPAHGRAVAIEHNGERLFEGLPSPFKVGLYHSLIARPPAGDTVLRTDAVSPAGEVMALSHRELSIYGLQFHPESILTEHGSVLLQNFLRLARSGRQI